jgi:hypothetical protein
MNRPLTVYQAGESIPAAIPSHCTIAYSARSAFSLPAEGSAYELSRLGAGARLGQTPLRGLAMRVREELGPSVVEYGLFDG